MEEWLELKTATMEVRLDLQLRLLAVMQAARLEISLDGTASTMADGILLQYALDNAETKS